MTENNCTQGKKKSKELFRVASTLWQKSRGEGEGSRKGKGKSKEKE